MLIKKLQNSAVFSLRFRKSNVFNMLSTDPFSVDLFLGVQKNIVQRYSPFPGPSASIGQLEAMALSSSPVLYDLVLHACHRIYTITNFVRFYSEDGDSSFLRNAIKLPILKLCAEK
jgi:hypothetical protein